MRIPLPDWQMAKLAVEAYADEGVSGDIGYDSEKGEWYAELNDEDHIEYLHNLQVAHHNILNIVRELPWRDDNNIQTFSMVPPKPGEKRLAVYLVDYDCGAARGFKINDNIKELLERQRAWIAYGSVCKFCGKRLLIFLVWEDVSLNKGG